MDKLHLEIVTPQGQIFNDDVSSVVLPGSEGEFGVLPNHASLISLLKAGIIDIEDKHKKHDVVAINWGYAKIDEGKVVILADGAVYVSGNSESELANSLEAARNLIESMSSDTNAFAATISKMENVVRAR
ncbi:MULTISPECIES: ATP synthase F1 subunit epsilon [Campylobacter]|jgi:ATP synthase F1, epsilon subunit|uniref:ATP synthase epsilon chain n=5 Tax=Campylobacter concisus TaxID=199 RepID=ATPE_CAMC1|nr:MULTISPECIES: ATP synthase F1 subunit epsilon [Campylobacter]A7ZC38.1 RecName: Full=ATP synthase epsilon chain; AltName: Full=ATP synthase F1 sector epsilon subunit; AltName: Full=F-ATPase epsilon subunit [Campylobacter concisus 13826]AVX43514.1 ATP synthase epsilon chain [Campylobacter concisus]EAT97450.1 ATP synthase, F1 complex, epsilon subunit [Campylobacter concisus 13826]EHL90699.1 ATP synthase epsilon chain [Campylobacter sp. 10_1_50]EIF07853.1 ATP synthase epsilon chain [Campylobact